MGKSCWMARLARFPYKYTTNYRYNSVLFWLAIYISFNSCSVVLLHDHIFLWQGHVNSRCKGLKVHIISLKIQVMVAVYREHFQNLLSRARILIPHVMYSV